MASKAPVPAFVKALPAPVRTMLRAQCGGDWRRVTRTADGGIVVHNNPQVEEKKEVLKPEPKIPAKPATPARPTPATIPRPKFDPKLGRPTHPPGYRSIGANGMKIVPRTKPISRKRSGRPRTGVEFTKRILDVGGQFYRIPGSPRMRIYYLGYYVMEAWCADNTPRKIVRRQYDQFCKHVDILDEFFS